MGLPAKRRTSRSKRERNAHAALAGTSLKACPDCGAAMLPHRACPSCGKYRSRQTVNVGKRADRAVRRAKTSHKH